MTEPQGTQLLLARDWLGRVVARDFIAWAVEALREGIDSPALHDLAGLDLEGEPATADAREFFRKALEELRITGRPESELVRCYVASLADDILERRVSPLAGAERIHDEVLRPLDHPRDLMVWCYLCGGLDPDTFEELEGAALDEAIIRAARNFVSKAT
jgi:hypothetical protein